MATKDIPQLVEAVVASGRTVVDSTGALIKPGNTATVTVQEAKRLRSLGYLVSDRPAPTAKRVGLRIAASDGPTVKLA